MYAFYFFCAIAFMAKGLSGLAIPGAAALFYLIASQRWSLLGSGELRLSTGVLIVTAVSLPWYLAMYVRHGPAFTNRLLIHDHINRLTSGVHGDNGTVEYFVAQIGYATFPWIALVPAALMVCLSIRSRSGRDARGETVLFLAMWLLSSFVLFSAMVTKYHHYILPAIIPAGILIGIAVAQWWGPKRPVATMLATAAGLCAIVGFAWLAGDPRGVVPADAMHVEDWVLRQAQPWRAYALIVVGAMCAALARRDLAKAETKLVPLGWSTSLGVALLLGACLVAFVGRDLSWATSARPQGNERLIHLFVYNYGRLWPEHLDYRAILTGFAVAAGVATTAAAFRYWRPVATRALVGVSVVFCAWGLNVYMVDLSDHWGLRDLAQRYYATRESADEPLVAWQMNWKGENFYTGNRVYVFAETDNKRIRAWLEENEGLTAYFVLEHTRLESFRKLVPDREIRELSTKRDCNKFLLVELEI
jgi:4-amino-4-deoxy-L-arabinose transferase-like glycosyltransferase